MEQNTKVRNEPTTMWSVFNNPIGKKQSLLQIVLGKLDSNMQKNETGPLSYTIHRVKFKMDERPKCETGNHQNPREEHRQ